MKGNVSKSEIIGGKSVTLSQFKEEVMDTVVKEIAEAQALVPTRYYVSELPTDDIDTNGTYLLTSDNGNEKVYNEYANINGEWFLIGGPFKDDFADLYSRSEAQAALELKADKSYVDEKNQTLNNEINALSLQKASATDLEAEIEERQAAAYELTERINECDATISTKAEQTDLNSEISDREAAVTELRTLIETNTSNIADKASSSELAEEISNRKDKYNELKTALDAKSDKTSLTTEINKREAADALLAADISKKADSTLLDNEVKTRKTADDTLSWRMTEHENGFNHPDGSVTAEKLGDDIMQTLDGKANVSSVDDVKNKIKYYGNPDIEITSENYFEVDVVDNIFLSNIGVTALENGLTDIVIPYEINGVKIAGTHSRTFYNCTSLKSITIPDGVTSIGNSTFYGCTSLPSIAIPDSVTSIGNNVFYNCPNLTIYCEQGSYADTYAKENNIPVMYTEISSDTYATKTQIETGLAQLSNSIDAKIAEAKSIIPKRYIVSELPTTDIDENGTYLVPANEPNTDNIYTEYAYINNAWEIIGNPFEVDLSGYATQENVENLSSEIDNVYTSIDTKAEKALIHTLSETEINETMGSNHEYRCQEVVSLTLALPEDVPNDYISSIIFTSGATATNLIYPDTVKMVGEGCIDGVFAPSENKRYNIIISYDGVNFVGVVGGYAV